MCHAVVTVRRLSIVAGPRRLLVCPGRGGDGALLQWTVTEQLRLQLRDTMGNARCL